MSDITANTHQAAYLTQGEVILNKNGSLVPAFYHSKCGGKTHMPEQVWGNQVDGYKSIECPFCHSKGQASWNYKSSQKSMVNQLLNLAWPKNPYKKTSFPLSAIKFFSHGPNDQLINFNFHDQILSVRKAQIRKVIGRNKISSTNFSINWTPYFVSFSGEGLGHGVGMCQIGAYELAKRGYNYRQILSFYYPDFQVKNYY